MIKTFVLFGAVCLCSGAFGAENAKVAGNLTAATIRVPSLGLALTPDGLRPVWGTLGADLLGDIVPLPSGLAKLIPAPGQGFGLAQTADQTQMGIVLLDGNLIGDFQPVAGALGNPDRIVFSPGGSSAVLYSLATQHLQILTGLPGSPQVARDIDATSLPGTAGALAVSDDAGLVLAAALQPDGAVVTAFAADGTSRTVSSGGAISAMRFLPGTQTAVIADSQNNQITLWAVNSTRVLATDAQGIATPLDLESSTDGHRVYVANSGAGNILTIDLASGTATALQCYFNPSAFGPLRNSAVTVMGQSSDSVWLLDKDAAAPWVAFAPLANGKQ